MLDSYSGVVYDLDGTVVDLDVDWAAVATAVEGVYADAGIDVDGQGLWAMLNEADDHGIRGRVETTIAEHERAGARSSTALPASEELAAVEPVAVCSLNCEAACRIALETHDLSDHVRAVIGRDSVSTHKPDPEPLLSAVDRIDVSPSDAVFIGDSERDAVTARRAGVAYVDVAERRE
ncbi:phosphoglycolate phosphatase [Natronoarchaeum philippinense]|uniref:Phosphoglycolate phosphatase n=1 Tax=Natronoarchaeum philippinense TaxID=558529 RepID=A0A285N3W3_NATPI|nr:HAD-IA family hydrolase [Natronoarchaeum philippinense]SNZ04155.1 phosphoglycolate phosphatase [Natronoarchaeum philippinense]